MNKLNQLFVAASAAMLTSPVFAAGESTVAALETAATSEMGGVKGSMIAMGVVLVSIGALGFVIYKIYSMSKGRAG